MSFVQVAHRQKTRAHNRRRMTCEQLALFPETSPPAMLGDTTNPVTTAHSRPRHRKTRITQPCFPGKAWEPKPRPQRRKLPGKKPTKPVGPRKQRQRYRYQQLIEGWQTDPTWTGLKACMQPGAPLMISTRRTDIKAARAYCDSCVVRLDCLHHQHTTHPRARSVGIVAGFLWDWERNYKRIVLASPDELHGWCPYCYRTFTSGRPATIHAQRCAEKYVAQILGAE